MPRKNLKTNHPNETDDKSPAVQQLHVSSRSFLNSSPKENSVDNNTTGPPTLPEPLAGSAKRIEVLRPDDAGKDDPEGELTDVSKADKLPKKDNDNLSKAPVTKVASKIKLSPTETPETDKPSEASPVEKPDEDPPLEPDKKTKDATQPVAPKTEQPNEPSEASPPIAPNEDPQLELDKPSPEALKADLEAAEREHKLQEYTETRQFFVPINAVAQKRSIKVSLGLTLLVLLLAIVLVDLMLDTGTILLLQKVPHTHFFTLVNKP